MNKKPFVTLDRLREIVEKGYRTITEDFPADEQS